MRSPSIPLSLALLATSLSPATAAARGPSPGPSRLQLEDRSLSSLLTGLESGLASVLSNLGLSSGINVDASKHGKKFDWHAVYKAIEGKVPGRHAHGVAWKNTKAKAFPGWATYKGNGVNLGAWLELETSYDYPLGEGYDDEWSWCEAVGFATCGPALDAHYAAYISTDDIDKAAKYGINTLRIPTST